MVFSRACTFWRKKMSLSLLFVKTNRNIISSWKWTFTFPVYTLALKFCFALHFFVMFDESFITSFSGERITSLTREGGLRQQLARSVRMPIELGFFLLSEQRTLKIWQGKANWQMVGPALVNSYCKLLKQGILIECCELKSIKFRFLLFQNNRNSLANYSFVVNWNFLWSILACKSHVARLQWPANSLSLLYWWKIGPVILYSASRNVQSEICYFLQALARQTKELTFFFLFIKARLTLDLR